MQIAVIGGSVRERDIQIALFFPKWIVGFPMHRERKDLGIVLENEGSSVSLMNVQVDDGDPARESGLPSVQSGDGYIVEHAEAFAVIRAGVMCTTGKVHRKTICESRAHGRQRSTHRAARPFYQFRRPGEPDLANLVSCEAARDDGVQVGRSVSPEQLLVGRCVRNQQLKSRVTFQIGPKEGILLHRKSVALGERKHELIAVESLHWRECNPRVVARSIRRCPGPAGQLVRRISALLMTVATMLSLLLISVASAQDLTAQTGGRLDGWVVSDTLVAGGGPVQGAVVALLLDDETLSSALTDVDGHFSLSAPSAVDLTLRILRIGFAPTDVRVRLTDGQVTEREFVIEQVAVELQGIGVDAERSRERVRFEEMGGVTMREMMTEELKLVPGIAEADPIRAIAVLPGVVSTSDFSSSFNVRGGSADQNLILLDGVPIFSPFHLGGFFSVFSADMVERVELQSGGFSAEHGGRVSSVLGIVSDPGTGEFEVDAGISVLAARATVAGGADRLDQALGLRDTRWRVSGRRSYFDQVLRPVTDFPYHLADLQGVLETSLGDRTRLRLSGYTGEDVLDLTTIDPESFPLRINWDWGNRVFGAGLTHEFDGGRFEAKASTTKFSTGLLFPDFQDTDFRSSITQRRVATDLVLRPIPSIETRFGLSADRMAYDNLATTGGTEFAQGDGSGNLLGAFGQVSWRQPAAWLIEAGVRLDHWMPDPGQARTEVAPRLAIKRFLGGNRWAIKLAGGRYTQFLHSLRDEELPIGLDLWVLSGDRAPNVVSDQVQFGVEAFPRDGWNIALEGFYRDFDGVVTFNNGDDPNDDLDDILSGTGTSWGADLFVRRTTGEVNGWLSLSFVKAERTFPDFLSPLDPAPEITYSPIFDRRVDLDLVLGFPFWNGWSGGLRLNVGTGTPYTRPIANYALYQPRFLEDGGRAAWAGADEDDDALGGFAVLLGDRNAERYPIYHRLDVSFRKSYEKSWGTLTPHVDILNVYNQQNVLFYFFEFDRSPAQRSGISMFPLLPTIGLEIKF